MVGDDGWLWLAVFEWCLMGDGWLVGWLWWVMVGWFSLVVICSGIVKMIIIMN